MKKILVIEDDKAERKNFVTHLKKRGYNVLSAHNGSAGLKKAERESPDIIILDIRLPDIDGITLLARIKRMNEDISVIMATAYPDMETTIKAMQLGAYDYVSKPVNFNEFDVVLKKAVENMGMKRIVKDISEEETKKYKLNNIICKSKSMKDIFKPMGRVSNTKTTVLIQGETGVGKELIARSIHYNSLYKEKPFIPVNCSAIVETLLESELFGYEKGAFTGASQRKQGKFELAEGGTLFLDEIAEMPLELQAKILRILQEREFYRVGGKDMIKTDVRIIASTNKNLTDMVKRGQFREDLYYRLQVVSITIPPLRKRKEDIPMIVQYLLNKTSADLHKKMTTVSQKAMDLLVNYKWSGNVRELENILTRAVILSSGEVLIEEHLPKFLFRRDSVQDMPEIKETKTLEELERDHIARTLQFTQGNKGEICRLLGISRPTLRQKIKKYGLKESFN
ncbi:MAG: sigma-54 dependent transcriptional regulator [Candidatus Mariimomonas ferrooxydans]